MELELLKQTQSQRLDSAIEFFKERHECLKEIYSISCCIAKDLDENNEARVKWADIIRPLLKLCKKLHRATKAAKGRLGEVRKEFLQEGGFYMDCLTEDQRNSEVSDLRFLIVDEYSETTKNVTEEFNKQLDNFETLISWGQSHYGASLTYEFELLDKMKANLRGYLFF